MLTFRTLWENVDSLLKVRSTFVFTFQRTHLQQEPGKPFEATSSHLSGHTHCYNSG